MLFSVWLLAPSWLKSDTTASFTGEAGELSFLKNFGPHRFSSHLCLGILWFLLYIVKCKILTCILLSDHEIEAGSLLTLAALSLLSMKRWRGADEIRKSTILISGRNAIVYARYKLLRKWCFEGKRLVCLELRVWGRTVGDTIPRARWDLTQYPVWPRGRIVQIRGVASL